jgi:hypothetical protein
VAAYVSINGVKYQDMKEHPLMDGKRSLNKALNQAAEPSANMQEIRDGAYMRIWSPVTWCHRTGQTNRLALQRHVSPQKRLLT